MNGCVLKQQIWNAQETLGRSTVQTFPRIWYTEYNNWPQQTQQFSQVRLYYWKLTKKSNNHLFRLKGKLLLWVFLFYVPSWCLPDALQWSLPFYVCLFLSFFDTPMTVWAWPWELCVWKVKALTDLISLLTFFLSSCTIGLWLLHRTENSCVVPWC